MYKGNRKHRLEASAIYGEVKWGNMKQETMKPGQFS